MSSVQPSTIRKLVGMGYSSKQALEALRKGGSDFDSALDYLLEHEDAPDSCIGSYPKISRELSYDSRALLKDHRVAFPRELFPSSSIARSLWLISHLRRTGVISDEEKRSLKDQLFDDPSGSSMFELLRSLDPSIEVPEEAQLAESSTSASASSVLRDFPPPEVVSPDIVFHPPPSELSRARDRAYRPGQYVDKFRDDYLEDVEEGDEDVHSDDFRDSWDSQASSTIVDKFRDDYADEIPAFLLGGSDSDSHRLGGREKDPPYKRDDFVGFEPVLASAPAPPSNPSLSSEMSSRTRTRLEQDQEFEEALRKDHEAKEAKEREEREREAKESSWRTRLAELSEAFGGTRGGGDRVLIKIRIPHTEHVKASMIDFPFLEMDTLNTVYDYCELYLLQQVSEKAGVSLVDEMPAQLQLVEAFPRNVLPARGDASDISLDSLGFSGRVNLCLEF